MSIKRLLLLWGEISQGTVVWAQRDEPAAGAGPERRNRALGAS